MFAHDKVAGQKAAPPKATTEDDERDYLYERASQYGEESIKIVRLQKTADPLVRIHPSVYMNVVVINMCPTLHVMTLLR